MRISTCEQIRNAMEAIEQAMSTIPPQCSHHAEYVVLAESYARLSYTYKKMARGDYD